MSRWSPESVNVLIRHQILDEEEAILLIEETLLGGQHAIVKRISTKIDKQIFNTLSLTCKPNYSYFTNKTLKTDGE